MGRGRDINVGLDAAGCFVADLVDLASRGGHLEGRESTPLHDYTARVLPLQAIRANNTGVLSVRMEGATASSRQECFTKT